MSNTIINENQISSPLQNTNSFSIASLITCPISDKVSNYSDLQANNLSSLYDYNQSAQNFDYQNTSSSSSFSLAAPSSSSSSSPSITSSNTTNLANFSIDLSIVPASRYQHHLNNIDSNNSNLKNMEGKFHINI